MTLDTMHTKEHPQGVLDGAHHCVPSFQRLALAYLTSSGWWSSFHTLEVMNSSSRRPCKAMDSLLLALSVPLAGSLGHTEHHWCCTLLDVRH